MKEIINATHRLLKRLVLSIKRKSEIFFIGTYLNSFIKTDKDSQKRIIGTNIIKQKVNLKPVDRAKLKNQININIYIKQRKT